MSLFTWKQKYFSDIHEAAEDPITAVEHSLKKWKGLKAKNLAKHDLKIVMNDVYDPDLEIELGIDSGSCALCLWSGRDCEDDYDCTQCPIYEITGKVCDGLGSPFAAWLEHNDPEPMIKVLKHCRKHLKGEVK
jgi:hypothetical protein